MTKTKFTVLVLLVAALTAGIVLFLRRGSDSSASVYMVPQSIPGDCSRPVEGEIGAFLAQVPNGQTVRFPKDRCYGQDRSLEINDRSDLTIDGNGSTFQSVTPALVDGEPAPVEANCRANWRVQGGTGITLQNMTVRGRNKTGFDGPRVGLQAHCEHGYSFDSTQGGRLIDAKAFDVIGDLVSIGPDRRAGDFCAVPPARDILVDRFYGSNSGRTVSVTNAVGVTIKNSYFAELYDNAIDIEPDVSCEWMKDITITDNRFGRYRFAVLNIYTNIVPAERSGNIIFSGNVAEVDPVTCFPAVLAGTSASTEEVFLTGLVVSGNDLRTLGQGISASYVADARFEDNTLRKNYGSGCARPDAPDAYGIWLSNSKNVNVHGNRLVNGEKGGFLDELKVDAMSTDITRDPT